MLKKSHQYIAACCAAGLIAVAGCSGKGAGVTPPVRSQSVARPARARIVTHRTYAETDASSKIGYSGPQYKGDVTTLPAPIASPSDLTYDQDDGNVYALTMTQTGYSQIAKISPSGVETQFLQFGYELNGIVYDHATQTFYVTTSDSDVNGNFTWYPGIYAVTASGQFTILAGGLSSGYQDGQGTGATFTQVTGITLNTNTGVLYVADGDRIRAVTTSGAVTTFTPGGSIGSGSGYNQYRTGITWSAADDNLYVADANTDTIKKVTPSQDVSVLAGQCVPQQNWPCAPLERNGDGTKALFAFPTGIAADPSTGNLFAVDWLNNTIRQVTPAGAVTTLAGDGVAGSVDGAGLNAEFAAPQVATYGNGQLYELEDGTFSGSSSPSIRSVTVTGSSPPPLVTPIKLFETKSIAAQPFAIDWRQPAKSLWYTELTGHIVHLSTAGVSTEYSAAPQPKYGDATDVVLGADGTPWFYDPTDGVVTHRNGAGRLLSYPLQYQYSSVPGMPDSMAFGPDGNVWLNEGNLLAVVTPHGVVNEGPIPNGFYAPPVVFSGDKSLWLFGAYPTNDIGKFDLNKNLLATYDIQPNFMTEAPDGNILFTQNDLIGKLNVATGVVDEYPIYQPVPGCNQYDSCSRGIQRITTGSDGAYYFTENGIGYIGRLDPNGGFSEYPIPAAHVTPFDILPGPDGNIWFTDTGAQKIGKFTVK